MYLDITNNVAKAIDVVKEGRVVAFPTGTSYGLAVDALQGHALQRLKNIKLRPTEKTFTVFLRDDLIEDFFTLSSAEKELLQRYQNQSVTLLLTPKPALTHLAENGLVGLRMIDHPIMHKLAQAVSVPLTATSANISEQIACCDTKCIINYFPGKLTPQVLKTYEPVDPRGALDTTYDLSLGCILDGGTLPPSQPSTIIKSTAGKIEVVREGKVKV